MGVILGMSRCIFVLAFEYKTLSHSGSEDQAVPIFTGQFFVGVCRLRLRVMACQEITKNIPCLHEAQAEP